MEHQLIFEKILPKESLSESPEGVEGTALQLETSFETVTSQQMEALRKAIERGNEGFFLDCVWTNPRYLINNAGDPAIIQEGPHYNALHVATRYNQSAMCLTIFTTINDPQFISLLYPGDTSSMIEGRIQYLLDLYLNMPDKELLETPLHFSCKYGCESILAVLLSYPQCDVNCPNRYGVFAKEMICDRYIGEYNSTKRNMVAMFEAIYFLPVMRDSEGIIYVGQPLYANGILEAILSSTGPERDLYSAFAGPMSVSAVKNFYDFFERKGSSSILDLPFITSGIKQIFLQVCPSDFQKGFKRVLRKLSKEMSVGWIEFWEALDGWFDLSSKSSIQGFDCLNKHLKKQHDLVYLELPGSPVNIEGRCDEFVGSIVSFINEFVQMPDLKIKDITPSHPMVFFESFQNLVKHLNFMTFSFSQEEEISRIHEEVGHCLYLKAVITKKESFKVLAFYLSFIENVLHIFMRSRKWKMFFCIMKFVVYFETSSLLSSRLIVKLPICDCEWDVDKDSFIYSSALCYSSILKMRREISYHPQNSNARQEEAPILEEGHLTAMSVDYQANFVSNLQFHVPPESPTKDIKGIFTSTESPLQSYAEFFVIGNNISDVDINLFQAIEDSEVVINEYEKPYIFLWMHMIKSKYGHLLKPDTERSCTPASSSATEQ